MCPRHFCRVKVTSSSSPSESESSKFFRVRVMTWSSRVRVESRELSSHSESLVCKFESHEISRIFYDIFLLWNGTQHAMKWCPTCFEMAPDTLENGAHCCFNKFDFKLFIPVFSVAFYLSFTLSHFKSLAQLCCKCCSLPVSVVVNVRITTNGMCVKNNTHVTRTSRNEISTTWDLYCCLVPQCEALRTCCSAFPFATKCCFDQDLT